MQWLLALSTPWPPVATWKQAVWGLPSYLFKEKSGDDCSWLLLGCDLPSCTHKSRRWASASSSPTIPYLTQMVRSLATQPGERDGRQEGYLLPNSKAEKMGTLKDLFAPQVDGHWRVKKSNMDIMEQHCQEAWHNFTFCDHTVPQDLSMKANNPPALLLSAGSSCPFRRRNEQTVHSPFLSQQLE